MEKKLEELKTRLKEVVLLNQVNSLLFWDQSTYMPSGGAVARGQHRALVTQLSQEKLTHKSVGLLLDELEPWAEANLPYDHDDAALIRAARRNYEHLVRVPKEFTGKFYAHISESYQAWTKARPENNFELVRPYLEKTVEMSRELANFFPGYTHIADPLIDYLDYGMKASDVHRVFGSLRDQLVPLVQKITSQDNIDDSCLYKHYPEKLQLEFGAMVIKDMGYDFERGRQDLTHHPFMTKFSLGDVRITTRVREDFLGECIFSQFHEAGHAIYEQGIRMDFEGTQLAVGTSAGIHESQSRLWENIVGRSRGFWEHYYPALQKTFPDQLGNVPLETFYRAINKVSRSLIRTDADEVTYNLHVMLRFDLELALLEGSLAVKDLPDAWIERYAQDLGVRPGTHTLGVLQDMHWYAGQVGGVFQGYTLGNILSAMFYTKALEANPEIPKNIQSGDFHSLHSWFKENIYQHGSKFTASELMQKITRGGLDVQPLIQYLEKKYGEIYTL